MPSKPATKNLPTRGGISPQNDALSITPSHDISVLPGQQITLSANTELQGTTLAWEGLSDNGQYMFTAPSLPDPCGKAIYTFKAIAKRNGVVASKTVSIHVEEPICHLGVANGLISDDTTKLLIANDGALFVGTTHGLSRYKDGEAISATTAANEKPLEIVTALGQSGSLIFVGKARQQGPYRILGSLGFGVEILQFKNDGFYWNNSPLFTDNYVSEIYFNPKTPGVPVFLTARSLLVPGGVHLSADLSFDSVVDILKGENIYAAVDYNDTTFFGGDNGIFVVRGHSTKQRFDGTEWGGNGVLGVAGNRNVRALARDSHDNIWIGLGTGIVAAGGLVKYNPTTNAWEGPIHLPGGQDVRALVVDSRDNLWIATENGLTLRTPNGEFKNFQDNYGLLSSDIRDLVYDREHDSLWIATGAGVTRWLLTQLRDVL